MEIDADRWDGLWMSVGGICKPEFLLACEFKYRAVLVEMM
jgi:hypothetical protein